MRRASRLAGSPNISMSTAAMIKKRAKQRKDPNYSRVQEAVLGFAYINKILRENSDAVWYGSSVGPEETDQVLLRWKLEDGTYRVIYGNLESENVTPIRLKQLEEK